MLPNEIGRCCSLERGLLRHTLSVFIDLDSRGLVHGKALKRTIITTSHHFTFRQVEDIINRTLQFNEDGFLTQDIMSLFSIAENLRYNRLHNASFGAEMKLDFSENDNFMSTIKSRMLVNEIFTLVNQVIRELLRNKFNMVPVFQSLPASGPIRDKLESWYRHNKNTMHLAVEFQNQPFMRLGTFNLNRLCTQIRSLDDEHDDIELLLQVPENTLALVSGLLEQNRFSEATQVICFDYLYPKQALASNEYHSLKPPSQYLVNNAGDEMCLVHFTSPLERYCDIVIQRFVHAYIDNTASPYSTDEIHRIRKNLNKLIKQRHPFENQCESLCFAQYLNTQPVLFQCFVCYMTEEDFQVLLPGFHQNSAKPFKIRFQDIKVCKIPEAPLDENECMVHKEYMEANYIENLDGEKLTRLVLRWRKRVYDYERNTIPRPDYIEDDEYIKLYPHQRSVLLKYEFWKEILTNVFSKNNTALRENVLSLWSPEKLEEIENDRESLECFHDSVFDVSSETDSPLIIDHDVPFQMSLHIGQILSIQMSAREESAILTPIPQILNLTNNIKFCLPHVQEPIKTLLSYAERGSMNRYRRVQEYQSIWLPIVEMESTLNAVQDREPVVINNIPIKFKGRQGRFDIDQDFCDRRDLSFGYIPDVDENDQGTIITERKIYHKIQSADYLCIMFPYPLDQETRRRIGNKVLHEDDYFWCCHAVMTKLCKYFKIENDRGGRQQRRAIIRVVFRFHEKSPSPPADGIRDCRMEVIFKSAVDKRIETNLKKLSFSSILSQHISLGVDIHTIGREQFRVADDIEELHGLDAGMWENNLNQNEAIKQSLKRRRFKLIQGPPGTGKTYVGVKLVYLFDKLNGLMAERTGERKKQIIFCGPSNKSVDLVARIVLKELEERAPKIVRVYGGAYEQLDYPTLGRSFEARQNLHDSKTDVTLLDGGVVLHQIIREEGKPYATRLNELDEQFGRDIQNGDTEHLQTTVENIKEYEDLRSKAMKEELPNYDVIFCTTSMVANPKVAKATKDRIRQLIIDESGMCSEPSSMCPIISTGADQVVLIGDHKQLRPIVKCRDAAKLGLETSLFERYSSNREYRTMLNVQYRMHPAICDFPSRRFYDGELRTHSSTSGGYRPLSIWPTVRDTHYPHVFCHVEGEDRRLVVKTDAGNEQSRSNEDEVRHVVRLFEYLVREECVDFNDINIMSQYNAQCTELRNALHDAGFGDFNVSTVVQSQGGEWNYVIFSLVRSLPVIEIPEQPTAGWCGQNLGFITDQNQINVALTRAKRGLIIVGNTHLLQCDPVWKDLISDYRKKGCVFHAENFPVQNRE